MSRRVSHGVACEVHGDGLSRRARERRAPFLFLGYRREHREWSVHREHLQAVDRLGIESQHHAARVRDPRPSSGSDECLVARLARNSGPMQRRSGLRPMRTSTVETSRDPSPDPDYGLLTLTVILPTVVPSGLMVTVYVPVAGSVCVDRSKLLPN